MTRTFAGFLSRKAVAASLAAALTFTSASVAPARADNNADAIAAAAFFGLLAAGIIATTRNDRVYAPHHPHVPTVTPRRPLPAQCRFEVVRGRDRGIWYERNCLLANYVQWPLLPARCEERVKLPRRHYDVIAYDAQCLAQVGYWRDGASVQDRGRDDRGHGDRR